MKFLFRFFLVLVVAVGVGAVLFYIVQALPGNPSEPNPPQSQVASEGPALQPEKPTRDRGINIRWRSLLELAQRVLVFAVMVVVSVIGKNIIFGKTPARKKND